MGALEIKTFPDKILRCKAQAVNKITQKEAALFQNMLSTMHQCSGIGLAAPQVGVSQRIIVADIGQGPLFLADPEVIAVKGRDTMEEGCLSVPETMVNIVRPAEVVIKGLNQKGQVVEVKAKGLLARVLLHEIDHLNGRLVVDYMNLLSKLRFKWSWKDKSGR